MNERPTPPAQAYPRGRRVRDAFRFIKTMAGRGSESLERTKSREVARTFGLFINGQPDAGLVKRIKAKFRNELSFGEGK
jgi:hypothetical protein